jgi:spoIIIJ-associated protein
MSTIEVEAKTLEEAINQACEQLGKTKDQLEVEVLSDSSSKMFGFIGSSKIKVRATIAQPKVVGDTQNAKEVLENILQKFGAEASIEESEDDDCITLDIKGDGSGILIGRKGQTLDAFQYLVNKIVHRSPDARKQIVVDTEGYRQRRQKTLIDLAKRLGEKAKTKNVPVSTGPLNPFERRIIHLALQDDAGLTTKSKGEGTYRSVFISTSKIETSEP